eukprot:6185603-Pleurochrysis_carterae.AAC.7
MQPSQESEAAIAISADENSMSHVAAQDAMNVCALITVVEWLGFLDIFESLLLVPARFPSRWCLNLSSPQIEPRRALRDSIGAIVGSATIAGMKGLLILEYYLISVLLRAVVTVDALV